MKQVFTTVRRRFLGWKRWKVAVAVAAASIIGVVALVFVLRSKPSPTPIAEQFASALATGDRPGLNQFVTDIPTTNGLDSIDTLEGLNATDIKVDAVVDDLDGDTAVAKFAISLTFEELGKAAWETTAPMLYEKEDGWLLQWSAQSLHPDLPEGGSLQKSTVWPERASILGIENQVISGAVEEVLIGIQPGRLESRGKATAALFDELGIQAEVVDEALDAPGVEPDHFVRIAQVSSYEFEQARDVIFPIPGLLFRNVPGRDGPSPDFAQHIAGQFGEVTAERLEQLGAPYEVGNIVGLSGLEAAFEEQLAGLPEVNVEIVDTEETVIETLPVAQSVAPNPVHTTIDVSLQTAAEQALEEVENPAAFVAVDSTSGEIRAMVSSPSDEPFNRALRGAYPPGSTYKVVTAAALLAEGLEPTTPVDCPPELEVEGKTFTNFEDGSLGTVPFSRAFAESCNTAFIDAAAPLPDSALREAADTFGFDVDYTIGLSTVGGTVPLPESPADRAASTIGQSTITASPLHMATVAAATLDGTWRSPTLLRAEEALGDQVTRPLNSDVGQKLPELMRGVVADGSGSAADVDGYEVIGKSGTAEYGEGDPLPTHAWFIAATEGLGIAVIVEDGESGGSDAAPVVASFLESQ